MNSIINHLSEKNLFSYYLSIFRIFLAFHIIKKIFLIWGSQSILFKNGTLFEQEKLLIDYLGFNSKIILNNSEVFLFTIVVLCICLIFGIGRKSTVILLYFFVKVHQELLATLGNGGDNLMIFVLLYFCFANSFEHFTLFKQKSKDSTEHSNFVSNLAVYSICIHLGYVYFISAIYKIHSDVWFNGTALYYILNLERFKSPLNYLISNNGVITTLGTYFTILFELLFLFLVWNKSLKKILLVSGLFLHLGIYFFMMIYDFEIFFLSLYGFFISNELCEKYITRSKLYVTSLISMARKQIQAYKI